MEDEKTPEERYAETLRKQEEKRKQIRGEKVYDENLLSSNLSIQKGVSDKGGQNKCPKCGSTDISPGSNNEKLRCNFCRHEFESERIIPDTEEDLHNLEGEVVGLGAQDIIADVEDVLTFKCSSCGAEVVIDTNEAAQARCHWCRNTLSITQQIPNGGIPDLVLPFKLKNDEAKSEIEKFLGKRKFFVDPQFKQEFTTQNIMGVYFPYMVIDINAHSKLSGRGERQVKKYSCGTRDNPRTCYDADVYLVKREFDIFIDDLTIESSSDKLNKSSEKTNNIINTIMPFDTENCVKWNANYLKGYSSEKRDINIKRLECIVTNQAKDIARYRANKSLEQYERGVRWSKEKLKIKGQKWIAAYLPVWLCSYQEVKSNGKKVLHYFAVNARTKEMMGSVPIHMSKLYAVSAIVGVFVIIILLYLGSYFDMGIKVYEWFLAIVGGIGIVSGAIYYRRIYDNYRNPDARHYHERETKIIIRNFQKSDKFFRRVTGLRYYKEEWE